MRKNDPRFTPARERSAVTVVSGTDAQAEGVEALAVAMPHNLVKPKEFGRDNAVAPPVGQIALGPSIAATASTLSERNSTDKTSGAAERQAARTGSLRPSRTDDSGQVLTTNQGVQVGDNQNSLKAGLRGPVLLEDFVLRD